MAVRKAPAAGAGAGGTSGSGAGLLPVAVRKEVTRPPAGDVGGRKAPAQVRPANAEAPPGACSTGCSTQSWSGSRRGSKPTRNAACPASCAASWRAASPAACPARASPAGAAPPAGGRSGSGSPAGDEASAPAAAAGAWPPRRPTWWTTSCPGCRGGRDANCRCSGSREIQSGIGRPGRIDVQWGRKYVGLGHILVGPESQVRYVFWRPCQLVKPFSGNFSSSPMGVVGSALIIVAFLPGIYLLFTPSGFEGVLHAGFFIPVSSFSILLYLFSERRLKRQFLFCVLFWSSIAAINYSYTGLQGKYVKSHLVLLLAFALHASFQLVLRLLLTEMTKILARG